MSDSKVDTGQVIIIFNCIRPYAYEINNLLALPNGFVYRFRFQHKWMPTIQSPSDLESREGLAVLRDFRTSNFVPLRRIFIHKIMQVGEVYYIEYVLKDIIELDSDVNSRIKQLSAFNDRMSVAVKDFQNAPGMDLHQLVFRYSDVAYGMHDQHYKGAIANRNFNSWGNLIDVIGQIEEYRDFDFFKTIRIIDNRGGEAKIKSSRMSGTARFHLRSNTIYKAFVFQRAFTQRTGEGDSSVEEDRQVTLVGEPGEIQVIQSSFSISGKYDLFKFSFKTAPTPKAKATSIFLEVRRKGKTPPLIDIPIQVSPSNLERFSWGINLILFLIGVVLLFGSEQLGKTIPLKPDLLERIGVILSVISGYGLGSFVRSIVDRIGIEFQI